VIRVEVLRDHPQVIAQRRRIRVEVHEHEARPGLAADRRERQLVPIDSLRKAFWIEGHHERAVDAVLPAVEQARELRRMAAARLAQAIATVHADVVAGAQRLVGLAHDEDRFGPELEREIVAGARQIRLAARADPGLRPHVVPVASDTFARDCS
jgi:hypothetical protein